MNHSTTLDVDEKIKMLQEVGSEERDGYRSKLEVPGVNLRSGATGETERDDTRITTYHKRTVGCQKTNSVGGGSSRSWKIGHRGARVHQKFSIRQNILQEDEGRATDLLRNRSWKRSLNWTRTKRLDGDFHLPNC